VKRGKKIFGLLAVALEYPAGQIVEKLNASLDVLRFSNWEAMLHVASFRDFCLAHPLSELEGIYARTFDLNAPCCPFVGHHLFGQGSSRHLFAEKVKDDYLTHVDSRKKDEPDHIAVLLRSLVVQDSVEEARELMSCCLIPTVRKMLGLLDQKNPYRHILRAVLLTLESEEGVALARPAFASLP
jgi:nitrate reductase assembly molybdenum cofactor insertion protein NarJ